MTDIRIKRCTVRVVRRGGWSWGASRRELAERVSRLLPELIATRLEKWLPIANHDYTVSTPLKLEIRISQQQLREVTAATGGTSSESEAFTVLHQRVDDAIRKLVLPHMTEAMQCADPRDRLADDSASGRLQEAGRPRESGAAGSGVAREATIVDAEGQSSIPALLKVLLKWHRHGDLGVYLRGFSLETLEVWAAALANVASSLDSFTEPPMSPAGTVVEASNSPAQTDQNSIVEQIARLMARPSTDRRTTLLGRIVATVEVVSRLRLAPADPELQAALDRHFVDPDQAAADIISADGRPAQQRIVELLSEMKTSSDVLKYLQSLSTAELREQHAAIVAGSRLSQHLISSPVTTTTSSIRVEPVTTDLITSLVQQFRRNQFSSFSDVADVLRARIAVSIALARQLRISVADPVLHTVLDVHFPVPEEGLSEEGLSRESLSRESLSRESLSREAPSHAAAETKKPFKYSRSSAGLARTSQSERIERASIHIKSALPFLLLGPLSEIGYLETLCASFDSAGLMEMAPAFATAFAYKVAEPAERGWQRSHESRLVAASFAGLAEPIPDSSLVDLASQASTFVSALNTIIQRSVHSQSPDGPLFLLSRVETSFGTRYLLVDLDGVFVICCAETSAEVLEYLQTTEPGCLLIEAETAVPALLSEVHRLGLRFLIDVRPTRGEVLRAISGGRGERWWTNDTASQPGRLLRMGRQLPSSVATVKDICREFIENRRAIVRAADSCLEDSLMLATSLAMSQIAWTLWHEREVSDPLLTLERFADLDAWVHFDEACVRVVLPLGKRSQDLADHRFLEDVVGVPWLDGRILTFGRG